MKSLIITGLSGIRTTSRFGIGGPFRRGEPSAPAHMAQKQGREFRTPRRGTTLSHGGIERWRIRPLDAFGEAIVGDPGTNRSKMHARAAL